VIDDARIAATVEMAARHSREIVALSRRLLAESKAKTAARRAAK
jgi:hypothetical protein